MVYRGWSVFALTMDGNSKKTEDDTGYGAFFIGDASFSAKFKINKAFGYIFRVEVAWVNLFTDVIGCSSIKFNRIYDGMVRTYSQVAGEVHDPLELWCRWGSSMACETVDSIH